MVEATETAEDARLKAVATARKRMVTRALLAALILVVGVWAIKTHEATLVYYFTGGDRADLGDVRQARASGKESLDARPGSFVRLENLMVTNVANSKKYNFFFCPIYKVLVRTTRPLPERSLRVARTVIPTGLEYLVEQRRVWVEDFSTRFDAEGWIMPIREAPGWDGGLRDLVMTPPEPDRRPILEPGEEETAWVLLDGESPKSHYWALIVLISVVFVVLASLASLVLAARAWRKVASAA